MKNPWLKFYPGDWRSDKALRLCSLAARGLWMEMVCLMHEAEPQGSLIVNGKALSDRQIATLAQCPLKEATALIAELEDAGVFSRENDGTIYSRRIRRDVEKADKDRENGKAGGNPKLKKGVNPPHKAQKLEARSQMLEATAPSPDGEAAVAPPPLFDREDFRRRCEEAAGCGSLSGFDLIEAMTATHDPEGRILPVLREKGAALRRKGKKPEGWSYFLPAIKDPACIGAQPCAKAPPVVWLDAGSPEFIAANRAMVARGDPPKTAIAINSQPNRGASFPAWAVEPAREVAA